MPEYQYLLRYAEPSAPSTYYYVSTHARSSLSTDTPASKWVPGGVPPLNFAVSLFDGIDNAPSPRGGVGSIRIADPTGELDYLIGKIWRGGTLTLLRGVAGAAFSTFTSIATMTTAGLLYDHAVKEIRLRDYGWILESALHDNRYDGTGGANGDASIAGLIKPYGIGDVFNATPQMVDSTKLILQLSDSAITSVAAAKDGGAALGFGVDRANYAAMAAATPSAGVYDTCLAAGYIRLGSSPVYGITVDFRGDNASPGAPYLKRGDIAKRIVTRAGVALSTGQVDSTALTALNAAQTGTCGFYWNREISKVAALNEVMAGCQGWWYLNLSGNLVLGALASPTGTALATYTWPDDIADPPSSLETYADPRWRTTLGYKRNYTVQDRSRLAGGVSDADAQIYAQDALWKTVEVSGQRTYWPGSAEVKKYSGFYSSADAENEATRQNNLFNGVPAVGHNLERLTLRIRDDPVTLMGYLGGVIAIAGYTTRYQAAWSNPRKFVLIGVEFSGDAATKCTLLG